MSKWYVEYKTHYVPGWQGINGIEAEDGKAAIEYVKEHIVIGGYRFKAFKDEDEQEASI